MRTLSVIILIILSFALSFSALAQSKKPVKKTAAKTIAPKVEVTKPTPPPPPPAKQNVRPDEPQSAPQETEPKKKNRDDRQTNVKPKETVFPYVYEFSQPNFVINRIVISHDETGKGTILFVNRDSAADPITDPIQLSQTTLDKLGKLFDALNFLTSTEDYQSPTRDYGHLGNHSVTMRRDGQERTAKYNWSENKGARGLADEYRKIGEQFIWYFDMNISRENQPLEAPGLVDKLDSMIKRDEISDPVQMLSYLKDLSNDERIPLLARNKTTKLIKEIEKKK